MRLNGNDSESVFGLEAVVRHVTDGSVHTLVTTPFLLKTNFSKCTLLLGTTRIHVSSSLIASRVIKVDTASSLLFFVCSRTLSVSRTRSCTGCPSFLQQDISSAVRLFMERSMRCKWFAPEAVVCASNIGSFA